MQVLAINRHGETIRRKISQVVLQLGDVLLIQGNRTNIAALEADQSFRLLGTVTKQTKLNKRRAPFAIAAFAITLLLATLKLAPLPVAALGGVLVVFLSRSITPEEAYRQVEWKAIILIGAMLGMGAALESTGTASFLAGEIVKWFGAWDPRWLLSGFFMLTMLLTQPMSNQAAAAVVVPIAMQTAMHLGVNPRTFAIMIAVGASCSFLTPLEPSCLLVYGPGRYKFIDFVKVGSILTLIIYLIAILLVPYFWPLR
jgi:di/tricarboxylate transporter